MTEAEKRLHRCAFTGHRPEKLTRPESEIKAALTIFSYLIKIQVDLQIFSAKL